MTMTITRMMRILSCSSSLRNMIWTLLGICAVLLVQFQHRTVLLTNLDLQATLVSLNSSFSHETTHMSHDDNSHINNHMVSSDTIAHPWNGTTTTTTTTTIDIKNKSSTLSSTTSNNKKLSLVLHVGPMKTATSTLQMGPLRNQYLREALGVDNYRVAAFDYMEFQDLVQACLETNDASLCDWDKWNRLLSVYKETSTAVEKAGGANASYNVLHSVETWSLIPRTDFTKRVLRTLLDTWNVHVVLTYRSLDLWLPSLYAQYRKGSMFLSRKGRWIGYPQQDFNPQDLLSFPDWLDREFDDLRDAHAVRLLYQDIFANDNSNNHNANFSVSVIDMYDPQGIELAFLCHWPAWNHTCQTLKQRFQNYTKRKIKNKSAHFLIEHDRLVMEAYRQNLLPMDAKDRIHRHYATLELQQNMQALNLTLNDFPQTCLTDQQEERLWQRTWTAEQETAPSPRSREQMRQLFQAALPKFCSVNVRRVLQNETWRALFQFSNATVS